VANTAPPGPLRAESRRCALDWEVEGPALPLALTRRLGGTRRRQWREGGGAAGPWLSGAPCDLHCPSRCGLLGSRRMYGPYCSDAVLLSQLHTVCCTSVRAAAGRRCVRRRGPMRAARGRRCGKRGATGQACARPVARSSALLPLEDITVLSPVAGREEGGDASDTRGRRRRRGETLGARGHKSLRECTTSPRRTGPRATTPSSGAGEKPLQSGTTRPALSKGSWARTLL